MTDERTILIRYDEIGLKGKNRSMFINRLTDNIRNHLAGIEEISLKAPHGRVMVYCRLEQVDECLRRLQKVPGIASASVGVTMEPDFDAMAEVGIQWIEPLLIPGSELKFCVRTRRSEKRFPKTSQEINYEVGSRILGRLHDRGLRVNIDEAEYVLEIEIGQEGTVVFNNRVPGLRGLPVGSAGKVLTLISGGIDSPVAFFRMLRRGCRVDGIFFDNQPFMGRGGFDKVVRLTEALSQYQNKGRLFVVPFEDIQVAIRDHCRPPNRVVLYRRMMYRIAEEVAKKKNCRGLVTGESLGQVASQTLDNLNAVSQVVSMSVFRPLIGMDKLEIIQEAKELGTFEISIEPQPDCCSVFMPPNPVTRSRIRDLEADELKYPWKELMAEAIGKMETMEFEFTP